jgi:hypothetical protein
LREFHEEDMPEPREKMGRLGEEMSDTEQMAEKLRNEHQEKKASFPEFKRKQGLSIIFGALSMLMGVFSFAAADPLWGLAFSVISLILAFKSLKLDREAYKILKHDTTTASIEGVGVGTKIWHLLGKYAPELSSGLAFGSLGVSLAMMAGG